LLYGIVGGGSMSDDDFNQEDILEIRNKLGVVAEASDNDSKEGNFPVELNFLKDYMEDDEHIGMKSRLSSEELAVKLSTLRMYPKLFPEVFKDFDDEWEVWLNSIEQRLTSVEGKSREEFVDIFRSLLPHVSSVRDDGKESLGHTLFGTRTGKDSEGSER